MLWLSQRFISAATDAIKSTYDPLSNQFTREISV